MTAKDWGRVYVATRYQPQLPAYSCESLIGLVEFGLHNAPDELARYVEALENIVRSSYAGELPNSLPPRPERRLRQGDMRDYVYSKTMHKSANILVRRFLQTGCDSICFIDSDAVFGNGALEELRADPDGWEFDVLQAFTVKRGWPPEPMFLIEQIDQPKSIAKRRGVYFSNEIPLDDGIIYPPPGQDYRIAVSLHFTLIRRELLERMLDPDGPEHTYWFEYNRDNGEDINFSIQANEIGARLGMTTKLKVGHVSEVVTGWDTMVTYYDGKFAVESGQRPAPSLDRIRAHYQAVSQLSALVAEFTGETPERVFQRTESGGLAVADRWRVERPQTPDEVRGFYGTTREYLYDLARWNTLPAFQKIMGGLAHVRGERVLEIGGGLGTTSEFLAANGNDVDYYDVPGVLLDFARWRFERMTRILAGREGRGGLRAPRILADLAETADSYDRIVAIDVIEHLHPDVFDVTLNRLASRLRRGGAFFAHNTFSQGNGAYPQHFDHSEKWAAFVSRAGLKPSGDFEWRKE